MINDINNKQIINANTVVVENAIIKGEVISPANPSQVIPSGTKMFFHSDTSPLGWTKVLSGGSFDYMNGTTEGSILVSTTGSIVNGNGIGGAEDILMHTHSFSHTHTFPPHTHTMKAADLLHSHIAILESYIDGVYDATSGGNRNVQTYSGKTVDTDIFGASNIATQSANTSSTGSHNSTLGAANSIKYFKVILCSKV